MFSRDEERWRERIVQIDLYKQTHILNTHSPKTNTTAMRIIYQSQSISQKMWSAHTSNIITDGNVFDIFDLSVESVLWIQFLRLNNLFNKERNGWRTIKKGEFELIPTSSDLIKERLCKGSKSSFHSVKSFNLFFSFFTNHIYVPLFIFTLTKWTTLQSPHVSIFCRNNM